MNKHRRFVCSLVVGLALAAAPVAYARQRHPAREARPSNDVIAQVNERTFLIKRAALAAEVGDDRDRGLLSRLSRSARIVPEIRDGQPSGFRLYAVVPGGLLDRLGFRTGDVFRAVNGRPVTSPETVLDVQARVRAARRLVVTVERNGAAVEQVYLLR